MNESFRACTAAHHGDDSISREMQKKTQKAGAKKDFLTDDDQLGDI